jgi:DNA-binding beta-propeller fold protein YncE
MHSLDRSFMRSFIALLISIALPASVLAAQTRGYRVTARIPVVEDGSWDFLTVDAAARRLYVTHGTRVQVLDIDADTLVGEIPNTPGVHGVAVAPDLGRGFTSNGRTASVTIFDLRTLATLDSVKVSGDGPDAIVYDSASRRVFTFNGRTHNATAIDAATGRVVGTIPLSGKPEVAVADGAGRIFVNIEDRSELSALDPNALTVVATWPLPGCQEPSGLALDRAHRRLFVVCSNSRMLVVNADGGSVVATLPIGARVDGTAFDPATQLAFSSNGEGTMTVIAEETPDRYRVVGNVPTERGARTVALDPRTHRVFTATAQLTPPEPATETNPHPRPGIVPGTFVVLVLSP